MGKPSPKKIIKQLQEAYPGKKSFDLDGRGLHFVCEVEPTEDHPEYDRAIEVIISSKPHKHLKTTQKYTIISGSVDLYLDDKKITLQKGDTYTIEPGVVHRAESNEARVEIYSTSGWTQEDHHLI